MCNYVGAMNNHKINKIMTVCLIQYRGCVASESSS